MVFNYPEFTSFISRPYCSLSEPTNLLLTICVFLNYQFSNSLNLRKSLLRVAYPLEC